MNKFDRYPQHRNRPEAVSGPGVDVCEFGAIDPATLDKAEYVRGTRRARAIPPGVYVFWGISDHARAPCGACGNVTAPGTVGGCQEPTKRGAAEHVTST